MTRVGVSEWTSPQDITTQCSASATDSHIATYHRTSRLRLRRLLRPCGDFSSTFWDASVKVMSQRACEQWARAC